jgi:preprotein translocase subunit SecA
MPIEARSVTKAIERAQNTVEQRNAEIRKNVLQYDEVMNEQRKVIYKRRDQILDAADLRAEAIEYLADAIEGVISTYCVTDFNEEWDLEGLVPEIQQFWPTTASVDELGGLTTTDEVYERLMGEAQAYYEQREEELGPDTMREVERQVMLRIIDQKWREHLYEMDYLQEGINLRAMGQKDPLVEWQREGYEMFGAMMQGIAQDFVKYIMHAQVTVAQTPGEEPAVRDMQYTAPTDPSESQSGMAAAARVQAAVDGETGASGPPEPAEEVTQKPIVKSEWDKTPRNAPCPCGSGKKFKLCHGR